MFYWFIKILLFIPFWILFPYVVKGGKTPKGKAIFICNHKSVVDPVMLVFALKRTQHCLAKKEIYSNWFLRGLWKGLKTIPIDREKVDISTIKTCLRLLKEEKVVTIFPEGTRNKTSQPLLDIKEGTGLFAVKSGAPITPIWLSRKPSLFRLTKIYVGESFYISKDEMKDSTEIIRTNLLKTMEKSKSKQKQLKSTL